MHKSLLSRAALIFISTTLSAVGVACSIKDQKISTTGNQGQPISNSGSVSQPAAESNATAAPVTVETQPSPNQNIPFEPTAFELALDKASGALSISQSAQSIDDWKLVANQYQDALVLMQKVTKDSPYFDSAQTKIREYQRQIKYAQEKTKPPQQTPPVVVNVPKKAAAVIPIPPPTQPQPVKLPVKLPPPSPTSIPIPVPSPNSELSPPELLQKAEKPQELQKVFTAPITRRIGGTPIVQVTFNGNRQFEMILDTGASGTVITQKMAKALEVIPVGTAKANTASAKGVEFPIGYVNSIEIEGARVNRVAVAIAGSELETGLLGHDFFGNYDITIKRNSVEFRPRTESPINSGESGLAVPVFPKPSHYGESP
ncbi:MAG: retropepsin-like aspartic protease [Calothrix sp. MO_167.B12]|nr:retropepsin-like aspartic protease [Calothrix sp. MO_167.B12]